MEESDKNLNRYLECESLIREFFSNLDYCVKECVTQKRSKIVSVKGVDDNLPGWVGCCLKTSSADVTHDLMRDQREKLYGEPIEESEYCGYHTKSGCRLETHKSPLCIAGICKDFREFLKEEYGINYYDCSINYHDRSIQTKLENILKGNSSDEEVDRFKQGIKGFTEKVSNNKK